MCFWDLVGCVGIICLGLITFLSLMFGFECGCCFVYCCLLPISFGLFGFCCCYDCWYSVDWLVHSCVGLVVSVGLFVLIMVLIISILIFIVCVLYLVVCVWCLWCLGG